MTIIDPQINITGKEQIQYQCDACGTRKQKQFRAWLQAHKITKKDWQENFDVLRLLTDLCQSCTVIGIHSNRSAQERSAIAKKGGPKRAQQCKDRNEHVYTCWVCECEFNRKNKHSKKMCPACLEKFGGKNWMTKIPVNVLETKIKTQMRERMTGKKNIMYGKVARHGRPVKLSLDNETYCFRSKWEAAFAVYLHQCGYQILYETETFEVSENLTYTPDFIIKEEGVVVEVKGFWRGDSFEKWNLFCKKYKTLNPVLLDSEKLKLVLGFNPKDKKQLGEYIEPYILG